jgi:hypothetical protein
MSEPTEQSDRYTEAHLVDALAMDPRFGELGASVRIDGAIYVIEGVVPTEERRAVAAVILAELIPEAQINNRIVVEHPTSPDGDPELIS